jgi:hypothetical protein
MSDESAPEFDINKSLTMQFGTPFVSYQWPDTEEMNQALAELLAELILAEEDSDDAGRGIRSNAGGWQSRGNLITRSEPEIQALKQRMETMVFNLLGALVRKDGTERTFTLLFDSWANVCRDGNYNVVHTHPNAMWSQVPNTVLDARTFVENRPGRMILFPSWVKHMVHPFAGSGVRISIACNVNVVEEMRTTRPQDHDVGVSKASIQSNS